MQQLENLVFVEFPRFLFYLAHKPENSDPLQIMKVILCLWSGELLEKYGKWTRVGRKTLRH